MTVEIERLIVSLEARIGGYMRDLSNAQAQTNRHLTAMEARFDKWSKGLKNSASSAAVGIGAAFGGIGAYLGARAVIEYANAWTRLTRSLDGSGRVFGLVLRPAEDLVKLANDSRVDIEAYSKLYIRTAASIRDYGFAAGTAETVTSTLAKALKLGSASASEQASVMLQFSQALQKGKLDGDEFRSVMENAGVVQELLAERLKVSKGEIVKMAGEGKLKIQDLVAAMTEGAAKVDRIYSQMPQTVDEAFAILRNNVIQYLGQADQATGASQALASAIGGIATNLDKVAIAAGAILGSAALRMTAFAAATVSAANPLTLLAAAVGGLSVAYGQFGDDVKVTDDGVVSLKDAVAAFAQVVGGDAQSAILAMIDGLEKMGVTLKNANTDFANLRTSILNDAPKLAGEIYRMGDAFDGLAGKVARAWFALQKWSADATGISAVLNYMEDARARQTELANDIALQRGIENRPNLGGGLADYLDGKVQNPRPKPAAVSSSSKRTSFEREVEQIRKRTELLKAEAATIDQTTLAQERAKAAAELRVAAEETAKKAGRKVTADEIAAINTLSAKYAEATVAAQFLQSVKTKRDGIDVLDDEIALLGLYGQELDAAKVRQDLLNEAKRLGYQLSSDDRAAIDAIAQRTAAHKAERDAILEVQSVSKEALEGFISDMRRGVGATEALANALDRLADRLISAGLDQLIAGATGLFTGGNTGGGGFSLFANGGIAAHGKPLKNFAGGGVSRSAAIFGEAGPEAAVPLPDGRRIPVDLRMPNLNAKATQSVGATMVTVAPVFNVESGTPPETIDKLRKEIPGVVQKTVAELFDRNPRFARSKI